MRTEDHTGMDRRQFLAGASGSLTAGLVASGPQVRAARRSEAAFRLDQARRDDFARLVGTRFEVAAGAASVQELTLVEAVSAPTSCRSDPVAVRLHRRPFSLRFRGGTARRLPQDTYQVRHPTLGTIPLFLVPVGPESHGATYEAIFG